MRTLYATRVKTIQSPEILDFDKDDEPPEISVSLAGENTVFIDVASLPSSKVTITLPPDVEKAMNDLEDALKDTFQELFKEHPRAKEILKELDRIEKKSLSDYLIEVQKRFGDVDDNFLEAAGFAIASALLSKGSLKDLLFTPLTEYFTSSASDKMFLISPLLVVNIPKGGGRFRFQLELKDILNNASGAPTSAEVSIKSKAGCVVPLRKVIRFRRC